MAIVVCTRNPLGFSDVSDDEGRDGDDNNERAMA